MSLDPRLTIVLTLKDRVPFTLRWMRFVNEERFPFRIIIADGGTDNAAGEILGNKSNFPNVTYDYIRYPIDESVTVYYKKVSDSLSRVEAPYLLLADNDDFFCVEGIIKSLEFLEENPEFVASRGNYLGFSVKTKHVDDNGDKLELYGEIDLRGLIYPSVIHGEENAADRLINYFTAWSPNWYNVYRTDIFRSCWNQICDLEMKEIHLMEHTLSALLVTKGKIFAGYYPYYYRQYGGQGVTASIEAMKTQGDYFDKMLIESWSKDYASFLKIIAGSIVERDNITDEDANKIVKNAYRKFMGPTVAIPFVIEFERKNIAAMGKIRKTFHICKKKICQLKAVLSEQTSKDGNRKLQYADQPTHRIREFLLKKP